MSGLRVTKSGLLAQIQDQGRMGYGDIGITQSGAADRYSAAWANKLLFNGLDAPVVEMLLGGVSLVAELATSIALTGAKATLQINGVLQPLWRVHPIQKGDRIEIGMASSGLRLYLAVKGGFGCTKTLGSCATTLKESFGEKLHVGDLLSCETHLSAPLSATPAALIPQCRDVVMLRVVLGYQYECFSPEQRVTFFSMPYKVTQATDRMGCRLQGEPITYEGGELISEPISYGAIQIPADGQPIVLLGERQTIGGYPKIGSVIPMDCYRLAQARPGTTAAFKEIGLEEAVEVTRELMEFFRLV